MGYPPLLEDIAPQGGPELDGAQDAINRMGRAHQRGTGCHLTAEMVRSLSLTIVAEWWNDHDPRARASVNITPSETEK